MIPLKTDRAATLVSLYQTFGTQPVDWENIAITDLPPEIREWVTRVVHSRREVRETDEYLRTYGKIAAGVEQEALEAIGWQLEKIEARGPPANGVIPFHSTIRLD
jgi:hypothetical protein